MVTTWKKLGIITLALALGRGLLGLGSWLGGLSSRCKQLVIRALNVN